jgi:hypothetical protein
MKAPLIGVPLLLALAAGVLPSQTDSAASLSVRIVPSGFTATGTRSIVLLDPMQHFNVVVTNTGKTTTRLWRESCSWGYANLSFEVQEQDGTTLRVVKKPRTWEKNVPDWMVIPPGDHLVLEVAFDPATWQSPPMPRPGQQRLVSLRAVYETGDTPEASAGHVWSGRVVSPLNSYTIFR